MKYFVLTGPECSGKSTLANLITQQERLPLVSEFSRTYLQNIGSQYTDHDLDNIALGQKKLEDQFYEKLLIVCDTDLLTIYIWRMEVYGYCDMNWADEIRNFAHQHDRYYFLCKPDMQWEYDPLRQNPLDRQRLFDVYQRTMEEFGLKYKIVEGTIENRIYEIQKKICQRIKPITNQQ